MHDINHCWHRWPRRSLLAAIPSLVMACDDPGPETSEGVLLRDGGLVDLDDDDLFRSEGNGGGIWVNNGLSDPTLGGIDPAFALASSQGLSEETGVLVDPNTWIVAEYLVECALPAGASIVKDVGGQTLVLEGAVGLAPEWQDDSCDEDCQEWISACMLARTNASQQNVTISLRASTGSIGTGGGPGYDAYEASFFGNVFADPTARYMCRGNPGQLAKASQAGRTCSSDPELCDMVAYDHCMPNQRCSFVWDQGFTAVGCTTDGDPAPYHTISVYVYGEAEGGNGGQ